MVSKVSHQRSRPKPVPLSKLHLKLRDLKMLLASEYFDDLDLSFLNGSFCSVSAQTTSRSKTRLVPEVVIPMYVEIHKHILRLNFDSLMILVLRR